MFESLEKGQVGILGIPLDFNSSFMRGPALAPGEIRKQFHSDSANYYTYDGTNLENNQAFKDLGDLTFKSEASAFDEISKAVRNILEKGGRVLSLGGDHSITFPILRAYAEIYSEINILHFDAHPDIYDELMGNKHSHASPFARIMENALAKRLIQIGIRCNNKEQKDQIKRFAVESHEIINWDPQMTYNFNGPVYISLDLDSMDPAFAPGVSHHEPGGLTSREVLRVIHSIDAPVIGADVVELNPKRDINGMTSMLAAKLCKEILAKMMA